MQTSTQIPNITLFANDIEKIVFINNDEEKQKTGAVIPSSKVQSSASFLQSTVQQRASTPPRCKNGRKNHSYREQRQHGDKKRNRDFGWSNSHEEDYTQDYDFQSELKKFDKSAFYDEVDNGTAEANRPPRLHEYNRSSEPKYRHDEMVIETQAVEYRQIIIKSLTSAIEYYTDNGLVIPCIDVNLRNDLSQLAHNMGLTYQRQIEAFGINSSQMILTVLGGSNRLRPRNCHQLPHVVILSGCGLVGARSLCLAKHLSNHNLHVSVLTNDYNKQNIFYKNYLEELELLKQTTAKLISQPSKLPSSPVDLVVTAIDQHHSSAQTKEWFGRVVTWCKENNAPNLCISPSLSTSLKDEIEMKWWLCAGLPSDDVPTNQGSVYLVDVGFTQAIYKALDIKYKSPFCGKPSIPLHSRR